MDVEEIVSIRPDIAAIKEQLKKNKRLKEYLKKNNLSLDDIKISRLIDGKVWIVLQKGTAAAEVQVWIIGKKIKVVLPL